MNMQEGEAGVEFTHTIEELLEPLADKDPKIIKAFLTTATRHPGTRLSLWALATLSLCNPKEYPEVDNVPDVRNLREEGLTEIEKRQFLAEKAIEEIKDISLRESKIEFKQMHLPPNATLRNEAASLGMISREIEALAKFRQGLGSKKGAGPSIGEAPGKSSV